MDLLDAEPKEYPVSTDQSPDSEDRPVPRRGRRQLPVVAVAAAVLVAGGGGAYWAATGSSDDDGAGSGSRPPKLTLDGAAARAGDGSASAPGDAEGPRRYRATGSLPDGPERAAVHRVGHDVRKDEVARLAKALKVEGAVRKEKGRWSVSGGSDKSPRLTADRGSAGGAWAYVDGTDVPLTAGDGGDPAPDGEPVSAGKAKDAVRPVLETLGMKDAGLKAGATVGGTRTVTVTPKVAGLPTHGWDSSFVVGPDGNITRAQGSWSETAKGAAYPVLSASATLDRLNTASRSQGGGMRVDGGGGPAPQTAGGPAAGDTAAKVDKATAEPDPGSDGKGGDGSRGDGDGRTGPAEVSDATFGLSLERSKGKPVLVPAWIYQVQRPGGGGDSQVTHPAVEPKFLAAPRGDGSGTAPGEQPGSQPPGHSAPGAPPKGDVGAGGRQSGPQAVEAYSADGRTLTLHFWGGVCSTYHAKADESGSSVKVRVTAEPKDKDGGRVCVKIAKRQTAKVELEKALGGRKVVDQRDGDRLPRK
ncbi:hypothetical protein HLB32_28280 [Streptomyces cacaoi]|nr:hypothetical protein [Streptomyces cacaoi]